MTPTPTPDPASTLITPPTFLADSPIVQQFSELGVSNAAESISKLYRAFAAIVMEEIGFKDGLPFLEQCVVLGLSESQIKGCLKIFAGGQPDITEIDASLLSNLLEGSKDLRSTIGEKLGKLEVVVNQAQTTIAESFFALMSALSPTTPMTEINTDLLKDFLKKKFDPDDLSESDAESDTATDTESEFMEIVKEVLQAYGFYSTALASDVTKSKNARWIASYVPEAVNGVVCWQQFNDDACAGDALLDIRAAAQSTLQQLTLQSKQAEVIALREGTTDWRDYAVKIVRHFGGEINSDGIVLWNTPCIHPLLANLANALATNQDASANQSITNPSEPNYITLLASIIPLAFQIERAAIQLLEEVKIAHLAKQQATSEKTQLLNDEQTETYAKSGKPEANREITSVIEALRTYVPCRSEFNRISNLLPSIRRLYRHIGPDLKDQIINALIEVRLKEPSRFFSQAHVFVNYLKDIATIEFQQALKNVNLNAAYLTHAARYRSAVLATFQHVYQQQLSTIDDVGNPQINKLLPRFQITDERTRPYTNGEFEGLQSQERLLVDFSRLKIAECLTQTPAAV